MYLVFSLSRYNIDALLLIGKGAYLFNYGQNIIYYRERKIL